MRFSLWLALLLYTGWQASAQILDDSSRQIYSSRTVRIRYEREMSCQKGNYRPDTTLDGFSEKLDFLRVNGIEFQNLGTFASASRPLLFELPAAIGKRNGMQAYDALIPAKDAIPYFTTLSPYTSIRYMQGARQRAMLQAGFAVNPVALWNVAAQYQRITALRIVNVSQQDERETDHHSLWLSSNFSTRNKRYRIWGNYRHLNHLHYVTGGAKTGGPGFTDSLFAFSNIIRARLFSDARNRDLRNNTHLVQELNLFSGFYLRSALSREKQTTSYGDSRPDSLYYGRNNFFFQTEGAARGEPDSLFVRRIFEVFENSAGIGWRDSLHDIHLYLKRRNWNFNSMYFPGSRKGSDLIFGFKADGSLKTLSYQTRMEYASPKEYDLNAGLILGSGRASLRMISYLPSIVQETFQSSNLLYERSFSPTMAIQLKISEELRWKKIRINTRAEWMQVENGIAFDSTFQPFQASGRSSFLFPGADLDLLAGKRWHFTASVTLPNQKGSRIAGIPSKIIRAGIWADLVKNRRALAAQAGFTLDWRDAWASEIFIAPNAQWLVQQSQLIPAYSVLNAFVNLRIDRVRVYLRVHNALQGVGSPGYFASPGYPAQRRLFEIGLDWTFFD